MRGRGVLFLVVGPSGVGKDSLIDGAKRLLANDVSYYFPKRYITRSQDAGGEQHRSVTPKEFKTLRADGSLMMSWEAHKHHYGIPAAAEEALAAGRSVVVNVSRQVIEETRRRWPPVRILLVTAPRDVLAARLTARGRETDDDIQRRLDRIDAYRISGGDVREVVNADRLDRAVDRFVALLEHELRMTVKPA
ncbi:MAG: phosphonate metabolism protein/1,5-bisphosphokinase (PRPP-forming) PhnN [Pseudomonadota bacterium]